MTKRLSLTLDPADEAAVGPFTQTGPERDALMIFAAEHNMPIAGLTTDAAVLRALMRAGVAAVQQRALEQGYAHLAAEYRENDHERRTLAARRRDRDATRD